MSQQRKNLLAIIEQGGYQNFKPLYEKHGFKVVVVTTMRKALTVVRKEKPDVIVAEFNYQSDFRDRTSSLESLLATVERLQHGGEANTIKVVVFYEKEYRHQLDKLRTMFSNFEALAYPIQESELVGKITL
jgi:hypothetical protein